MGKDLEGYVEVHLGTGIDMAESSIEVQGMTESLRARLWRWGAYMTKHGSGKKLSASWAREYIAYRDFRQKALAIKYGMVDIAEVIREMERLVDADDTARDAWAIESAWRRVPSFTSRNVLLWRYVYGWDVKRIRSRMNVRGSSVNIDVVIGRAELDLKKILDK